MPFVDSLHNIVDTNPMKFRVTSVQVDFEDGDFELPPMEQIKVIQRIMSEPWFVDDEDDLVDEITDVTGWCIKSINYQRWN